MTDHPVLTLDRLRFGYSTGAVFLGPISLDLPAGTLLAVVGPNGAGKSTLLRLLTGLLRPTDGVVSFGGRRMEALSAGERAKHIAFLPQQLDAPPDLNVQDVVMLGRYPHRRFQFFDSIEDQNIAAGAMKTTRTDRFTDRTLDTLSAGERQRVHLAAALAQQPRLFVLDEPTSALDPFHQLTVFGVLRNLCDRSGITVVVATHDLNLAGQHADTTLLLHDGRIAALGTPDQVLRTGILKRVYGVAFQFFPGESGARGWVFPVPGDVGSLS